MPERENPNARDRKVSAWVSDEELWNFSSPPDLVWITSRIGWEGQECSCLFDLLHVRIMPVDNVPLQVSNGFIRLTKTSEFNVLLKPEVKLQRALQKL
jgi:hypothetical protein